MIDEKKCKGVGKGSGYGCGKLVKVQLFGKSNRIYGLGLSCKCYSKWLVGSDEGKAKIKRTALKVTKPRMDLQKGLEEAREEIKLSNLLINVRYVCHNFIKLRDKGKPCVSCGEPWNPTHQAGHWKKAELYSSLRFDETNIHNQCKGCNLYTDGNVQKYGDKIILRITDEQKEAIEYKASQSKKESFKWDINELKEMRTYYNRKLKELKQ